MRIILFTTIALISLSACQSKKDAPKESIPTESKTPSNDSANELTEPQKEEKFRDSIYKQYVTERSKCSQNVNAVTDFNGKTEFWRICEIESGYRIIQINSHEETELYEEIYFERNGELIYAEESVKYMPINHFTLQPWTCQFYAEDGELITFMSLGHGKTEDDKWNPEIIFEMHKKRIAELNKIERE